MFKQKEKSIGNVVKQIVNHSKNKADGIKEVGMSKEVDKVKKLWDR